MKPRLRTNAYRISIALLPLACAKVTTNYPDFGVFADAGDTGTGGSTSALVTSISTSVGGAAATGGSRATGGLASVVGGGGTTAAATTLVATGGASAATGGAIAATGGALPTGGAPGTGGVYSGDAGTGCPSGTLFCDDFEAYAAGGPASLWTASSGTWSVVADPTAPVGDQNVYSNTGTSNSLARITSGTFANASIEARIRVTAFSSTSSSNAAGIFMRSNGSNDYDLALGGDGKVYLRRDPASSTEETCTTGTTNATSNVPILAVGCPSSKPCTGWFRLKLSVTGTVAAGISVTGYVDATASGTFTQVIQCTQTGVSNYMFDSGTAGVYAKGSAPANYDDVVVSSL